MEFEEEEVRDCLIWETNDFCFANQNRPRPEFAIGSLTAEKNPVTGILEPYFPAATRRYRIITGVITLSVMVEKQTPALSLRDVFRL